VWTSFNSQNFNVSENVTWDLTDADGVKNVYAWVRNVQDNISVMGPQVMQGYDNITLDATAPTADNATPKLTGTRYTSDSRVPDNYSALNYVDNLTVALDNLSTWKLEKDNATGSGLEYGEFYLTDNETFKPILAADDITWNTAWRALDNLSFTFGSDWNDNGTLGNTSLGLKTVYVWAKDNASNVSGNYTAVSITFDNESPVFSSFYLRDTDNGTGATTGNDFLFTNSDNVSIPLDNLTIAVDNGTGIAGYYFIDNTSGVANFPGPDNVTWLTDNGTLFVTFDNGSNQEKTISGYLKDAAGQISTEVIRKINFDNNSPVIDNITWQGGASDADNVNDGLNGLRFYTTNAAKTSGNLTVSIMASDNASGDTTPIGAYSSKMTHFFFANQVKRTVGATVTDLTGPLQATDDNVSSAAWIPLTSLRNGDDNTSLASDNVTFDNASHTINFTMLTSVSNLGLAFDSANDRDCATVVGWFKDNASNISGNRTVEFNFDNSTIVYK
jgi:hypothetical protein